MNFIPLFLLGGIGDLIISLAWIENIIKPLNIPVHLYSHFPEIAEHFLPWISISKDMRAGERAKLDIDYFISISDMIFFERLTQKTIPDYIQIIYNSCYSHKNEWEPYLKVHPYKANEMAHKALSLGHTRWSLPFLFVNKKYEEYIYPYKIEEIIMPEKFITVHDGFEATGYYKFSRSMKSWSIENWEKFVSLFKEKYPDIHVVQLGGVKHQKIKNVDINLAGQLRFEESLHYLNSSLIHIDGDSGLVHARQIFKKPSIVMFGPTNPKYFGYPENINLIPKVCGDCWWKKNDWMQNCIAGYNEPKCIQSITPEDVLKNISLKEINHANKTNKWYHRPFHKFF